jgi:hypothetical protein
MGRRSRAGRPPEQTRAHSGDAGSGARQGGEPGRSTGGETCLDGANVEGGEGDQALQRRRYQM